ncbi:MAG: Arm DNA-binding domain-containing protein, partial [Oscillospiraceae bacterium]
MASHTVSKFTDNLIKGLKAEDKKYVVSCNSLQLRVFPTGVKSWCFGYKINKKNKYLSIGQYPLVNLSEANQAVLEAKKALANG